MVLGEIAAMRKGPKLKKDSKGPRTERDNFEIRWQQLDSEFSSWEPQYREISKFLLPRNGRFFVQDRNRGERRHNSIYDNTGTRSLRVCGSGIMSGATSPARPWMRVVTSDPKLNRQFSVRKWLDEVTRLILRVFEKSNTYRVLHMMYEEMAAFGTAACIMLPDFNNVLHLHAMTCGEYRLATNSKGEVDTCYRTFERTVAETVGEFTYEKCSKKVQDAFDEGFLENKVVIRHVIEPRKNRNPNLEDNLNMPWKSVYYEVGCEEEDDYYLRESGFQRFPVLVMRWNTVGGDVYGHGPGMEALGDIKQLQHEQLRKAQGIDFQSLPPTVAPAEMKGQELKWVPGGTVYVNTTAPNAGIRTAFEVKLDLEHLLADIVDVRERIRGSFFADLFLMLTFQNESQKMTATEVAARHEEKLIQLGPVLENLHDQLRVLVENVYWTLSEANALPPAPPEISGMDLSLEFISMLAQAQRAVGVAGIERLLLIAGQVVEAKPDILDNLNEDELWSELSDMIGVSPRISNDPAVRDKLRRAKLESQKAAAQVATTEQATKGVKNMADAQTASPNALSDVMSAFSGYNQPAAQNY